MSVLMDKLLQFFSEGSMTRFKVLTLTLFTVALTFWAVALMYTALRMSQIESVDSFQDPKTEEPALYERLTPLEKLLYDWQILFGSDARILTV